MMIFNKYWRSSLKIKFLSLIAKWFNVTIVTFQQHHRHDDVLKFVQTQIAHKIGRHSFSKSWSNEQIYDAAVMIQDFIENDKYENKIK